MITYRDQPVPVFTIQANWKAPILLTEDWNVFARESIDVSETRRGSFPRPLYKLEFSTLSLSAQEQGYMRKMLEAADAMPIAVPFWQDAVPVTVAATAGNPWIDVEFTAGTLFDVLPAMLIWTAFDAWEIHRVAAVNDTQVQVTDAIEFAWPVGAKVVPCAVGKLAKPNASQLTDINGVFKVKFEERWLNEGPMLCYPIVGDQQGATLPFVTECIGGAIL